MRRVELLNFSRPNLAILRHEKLAEMTLAIGSGSFFASDSDLNAVRGVARNHTDQSKVECTFINMSFMSVKDYKVTKVVRGDKGEERKRCQSL